MDSAFLRASPHARKYWESLARKLAGQVDVIDPVRVDLRDLRKARPDLIGKKLYRASTGGKWGKSSKIVTL